MMLKGKNAIITGARTGIGLACLRLFAENGCNCWAVVHRQTDDFRALCEELSSRCDVRIETVVMELASSEEIREGMKHILRSEGGVDILVNAAGAVSPSRLFTMTPLRGMKQVMDVNFFAPMELAQLASRSMLRKKSGCIVNIASVSADGSDGAQLEYAASKAALICATRKLAMELGPSGIRVNAVSPGLTDTKMLASFSLEALEQITRNTGLQRKGTPEEIANVCLFLCSEQSSFINGETIRVDGGSMRNAQ